MLLELHGGAGVMQAASWPSRVVGKGSTIETHIRLGSSWSVGGPVLYSSHCPKDVSQRSLTMNLRQTIFENTPGRK